MKFRLLSDLHFEYTRYHTITKLPVLENEQDMVVILAGDIFPAADYNKYTYTQLFIDFVKDCEQRHRHVVWVAGNHEYYRGDIELTIPRILEIIEQNFTNTTFLENNSIRFDDVEVIGATLWTNFYNGNANVMWACRQEMFDYKNITNVNGPRNPWHPTREPKIIPDDLLAIHKKSYKYIFDKIAECDAQGLKTVVVTHHGPSALSITEKFKMHPANGGYVSDFTEEFLNNKGPHVWCHGHVHSSHDYSFGRTRVLCNPHGIGVENLFPSEENNHHFDYKLNFEV